MDLHKDFPGDTMISPRSIPARTFDAGAWIEITWPAAFQSMRFRLTHFPPLR
jgi:hypothetical protein